MTQSVYVIGGAGSGKSTFLHQLMDNLVMIAGPLEDLHGLPNKKNLVTLRGHSLFTYEGNRGLYIGCIRERFPGTDGLDRASSPVGEDWLNRAELPAFIISEGSTLATRRFLTALHLNTELLLVHLYAETEAVKLRFGERGSFQDPAWVQNTVTRSSNLLADMKNMGVCSIDVDTLDPEAWVLSLDLCKTWVEPAS